MPGIYWNISDACGLRSEASTAYQSTEETSRGSKSCSWKNQNNQHRESDVESMMRELNIHEERSKDGVEMAQHQSPLRAKEQMQSATDNAEPVWAVAAPCATGNSNVAEPRATLDRCPPTNAPVVSATR